MSEVKPMALSTAIRLGAMLRPQATGWMFLSGGSCTLGAAYEAANVCTPHEYADITDEVLETRALLTFPILSDRDVRPCPDHSCPDHCMSQFNGYLTVIVHLNDDHHWTRERIADWVETLEASQLADYPQTPQTIASAKAQQAADREAVYVTTGIRITDEEQP